MEVELKLSVAANERGTPEAFFRDLLTVPSLVGHLLGAPVLCGITDLYYDTTERTLAKCGTGLRVREKDGRHYLTLKINHRLEQGIHHRLEYESPLTVESVASTLRRVRNQVGDGPFSAGSLTLGRHTGTLVPVLRIETRRVERTVGSAAVLALDTVRYPEISDSPFYDIEVEAAATGDGRMLRLIGAAIVNMAGERSTPLSESKLARGLRLASTK